MHHYVKIALVLCSCLTLTTAQFVHYYSDFSPNFAPSYNNFAVASAGRDARESRGPVLFPASPPGDASQTSGVIVGASGFGFVPPSHRGPAIPRYFYRTFYGRR